MKSMLHEASSIMKAIENAWNESGKPTEFTIKILEQGEKGFLWFSKHPAIVSLTYDPRRQPIVKQVQEKKMSPAQNKQTPVRNKPLEQRREVPAQKTGPAHAVKQRPLAKEQTQMGSGSNTMQESMPSTWTPDFVDYINVCLKELITKLAIDAQYVTKVDNRTLFISFNKRLVSAQEEEKILFISISYLLMQFLKKKYKKKLKGFHLVIMSKDASTNDKTQPGITQR